MAWSYTVKPSRRSKYMRLSVREGGDVVVTVPFVFDAAAVERFVVKHTAWVDRVLDALKRRGPAVALPGGKTDYLLRKEEARRLIETELQRCNRNYGFTFGRVSIRNQKRCWGSCSARKNLNFNYRLLYLPPELREYVVVHELCHLKAFGHGADFWALVEQSLPDWRERRKQLRRYRLR